MTPLSTTKGLPTHKDLPETDGRIVDNYQEEPQSALLIGCLFPRLSQLRPDGLFSFGADNGIYWRLTDPPLDGCKSPDFFIVLGVPPLLEGELRRSYVLWQEHIPPLLAIEYVSADGREEHDATPGRGKFWVYEQGIGIAYYLIFDGWRDTLEGYQLHDGRYQPIPSNTHGRFPIPELGVEFGLWEGCFHNLDAVWVRAWDIATGELLPTEPEMAERANRRAEQAEEIIDDLRREADEQTEQARQAMQERQAAEARVDELAQQAQRLAELAEREKLRAEQQAELAEREKLRAERLAERLRQLGIDPEAA